ncbi:protein HUA2-LIKE 2-like [Impatiens glandulifera]|uniref:protein HUA2-LIKE 2-like n=1 Tax=Impatiens glandulifera TaxID=253017 RepID=UPI001FB19655|nr:protein HUA2-LIKE 2-like [Impatiens glandulifera]
MAPSRRKTGRRSTAAAAAARRQWKVGDLVLAKVKGFPAWPATVSEPEKWGYSSDGKKVLVYFFGTQQIAFSNPIDVEPFTEERKESLLTKRHGKGADFIRAVHEIIDSYEQLKKGEVTSNSVDNVTWKNSGISEDNLGLENETPDVELSSCGKSPLSVEGKWSNNAVEDSVGTIRESDNLHDIDTTRAPKAKNQGNAYFSRKRFRGVQLNSCPSLKKVTAPRSSRSGKCILSPGNDGKAAADIPSSALRDGTRINRVWESPNVNGEETDPHAMTLNGSSKENGAENLTVHSGCKLQQIEPGIEHCVEIELNQNSVLVAEAVVVRKKRNQSRKRAIIDASDAVAKVAEDTEVEVRRTGQDFPDVRSTSLDEGDEHLPLVKRARVRLGRSSSKKEDLDISTLLEEKSSLILNTDPGHVCTSLTHDVDYNVVTKSHIGKYDVSDSVIPTVCSQFAVDQLQALDDRSSAKLGCLVDGEATLPPSKRLHRALEAMSANAAEGTKSDASLPMKTCIYSSYSNKGSPEISLGGGEKGSAMETFDLSNMNASQGVSTGVSTSSELPLLEEMAHCSGEEVICCKHVSKNGNHNNKLCEERALEILEIVDMKSLSLPSLGESNDKLLGCNEGSLELSPSKRRGQDEYMDNHHKIEKPLENLESVNMKSLSFPSLGESVNKLLDNHHKIEKPLENLVSVDENMDNHHKIEKPLENLESVDVQSNSLPSLGESMYKLLGCNEVSLESLSPSKRIGQDETMHNHQKIEKPLRKPDTSHDCQIVSDPGLRDEEIVEGLPGEGNFSATTRPSNSPATEIKEAYKVFHVTGDIKQTLKGSHVITSPTTLKDIEAAECLQNLSLSASISLDNTGDRDISGQGSSSSMTNRLGSIACESPPSTSICNDYTVETDRIVDNTGSCVLTSHVPHIKPKDANKWSSKTEATAALASFEAALVTLTRTKENITGASRIAIDCAKYGNAFKVVEIIARNLETEPNLHRRVDLFFLVDSIAQCSRGLKGEVGDIYPAIQEFLKRILLAAAPPGSSTLENCRQCLKVLRLWLERRILPDSIIRHHIRELESLCSSSSGSVFAKRTMRTERPFDDPIRGMDGMLVDEYGSNSNFKLAGFCMPPMLKDEEDGSDSDSGDFEAVTPEHESNSHEDREVIMPITTVVKHTCVLEEVDGELEMEDVSPNCDDEMVISNNSGLGPLNAVHQFDNNIPLPFLPPLPVDMPPSSPPLPTSPPPPPPPPPTSSIPVPFDSKVYVGHNMASVNPESLPFHAHEHREIQMQPSVQGACTSSVFNGQPIPNLHMQQQHVNGIQENNGSNSLHNAGYPMHSLQPAPSNQFSYVHSDQWLQSQREVPCPYPGPVGGNFCNEFDRRNMGPHETGGNNWRFPAPPVTGGSYAQHYPGPVCDPPNEQNHGWGFPQWNGNHQDFMPHRPPPEGPMPVPIRAPCFWQPR